MWPGSLSVQRTLLLVRIGLHWFWRQLSTHHLLWCVCCCIPSGHWIWKRVVFLLGHGLVWWLVEGDICLGSSICLVICSLGLVWISHPFCGSKRIHWHKGSSISVFCLVEGLLPGTLSVLLFLWGIEGRLYSQWMWGLPVQGLLHDCSIVSQETILRQLWRRLFLGCGIAWVLVHPSFSSSSWWLLLPIVVLL